VKGRRKGVTCECNRVFSAQLETHRTVAKSSRKMVESSKERKRDKIGASKKKKPAFAATVKERVCEETHTRKHTNTKEAEPQTLKHT
jgi:hypothetical protein